MPVSLASRIYLFSISFRINIGNSVSAVAAVLPPDQPRVHPLALLDYQVEPLFIYLNLKGRGLLNSVEHHIKAAYFMPLLSLTQEIIKVIN